MYPADDILARISQPSAQHGCLAKIPVSPALEFDHGHAQARSCGFCYQQHVWLKMPNIQSAQGHAMLA